MKKSVKVRWTIGLLIFQMASTAISLLANYPFAYFISLIFECIPTIGAIVLIFYDHTYKAPVVGKFTLLRAWTLGLIWVQPVLSLISWGASGLLDGYIIGFWIGSCVFIIIATVLLVQDGQTFVKSRDLDSEHKVGFAEKVIEKSQNKIEFEKSCTESDAGKMNVDIEDNLDEESNGDETPEELSFGKLSIAIFALIVITIIALIIVAIVQS